MCPGLSGCEGERARGVHVVVAGDCLAVCRGVVDAHRGVAYPVEADHEFQHRSRPLLHLCVGHRERRRARHRHAERPAQHRPSGAAHRFLLPAGRDGLQGQRHRLVAARRHLQDEGLVRRRARPPCPLDRAALPGEQAVAHRLVAQPLGLFAEGERERELCPSPSCSSGTPENAPVNVSAPPLAAIVPLASVVASVAPCGVREPQGERLGRLRVAVAERRDRDRLHRLARREAHRPRHRHVVGAFLRRAIGGLVVDAHRRLRRLRQLEAELERLALGRFSVARLDARELGRGEARACRPRVGDVRNQTGGALDGAPVQRERVAFDDHGRGGRRPVPPA